MTGTTVSPPAARPSPPPDQAVRPDVAPGPPDPSPRARAGGHQAAIIAGGRIGAAAISALWLVVAARTLTLGEFSDLALVLAIGSALFFLTDAGYSTLLSAHVAECGAIHPAALAGAIRRRLAGTVVATGALVVAYAMAADDRSLVIPLLFAGSLAGNAVYGSISAALRSVGQVVPEAANEVLSRVLVLALGAAWLVNGGGVRAALIVYVVGDVASCVGLGLVVRRWTSRHPTAEGAPLDLGWRRVLPISIGAGFTTIYGRLDTWLVALLGPPGSAGLYAACYRIVEAARLPAQAVGAVTLVEASRADAAEGARLARRRAAQLGTLAVAAAAVVLVAAEPIMRFVFGGPFAAAAGTLRILALATIASAVVSVLAPYVSVRRGTRYAAGVGVVLLLNASANVVLIPALGGAGAAWANLASECLLASILVAGLSRDPAG